jgi:putative ABC transport system permease protein
MFKFIFRYFHDIEIAVESIISNKLKSMLTALGIIFGVAAVIAMLAIGKGAKQEIMEQMEMVGVNNILINPIIQDAGSSSEESGEKQQKKFPGLKYAGCGSNQGNPPFSKKNKTPNIL